MSYANPLHPPVRYTQRSQYSSLCGATGFGTAFLSPTRQRMPQKPYTPTSKWDLAMGQNARLHSAIQFDHVGYTNQSIQMRELTARSSTALEAIIQGANDPVFAHTGLERITLRIIPGYENIDGSYSCMLGTGGRPITRAQLGVITAQNSARFVEKTRSKLSSSQKWNLTSSGIRFEHLVLVALVNVWEGTWQAEVAVDLR
ncbi:hypothetical protein DXG01_006645 [Tephrocybe rancida]|nr:hypothetical protein DXG01_006645 [Tephrocybe rancida]